MTERCDVAIIGGGPVGLLLGCLLTQRGLDVRVLERDPEPRAHSRAIGVHPPGLACLAEVGAADAVLARGVCVRRALAFGQSVGEPRPAQVRQLGRVSFDGLPGPYPFVLCVPQSETERALEAQLARTAPHVLRRGHTLVSCRGAANGVTLHVASEAREHALAARFVVGCDGKRSAVRHGAGIAFPGGPYREHFVMADVVDDTPFASDAAIYLARDGVVESFPLPGGRRRFVVGLRDVERTPTAALVAQLVLARTGLALRAETASMVSGFTAERYLASRFVNGSLVLAGDAAHVLSPIGGQGMNLGWLDAKLLATQLAAAFAAPARADALLAEYAAVRRRAARDATRRAELFMTIGQSRRLVGARDALVALMLSPMLASRSAELFTMRGLASADIA